MLQHGPVTETGWTVYHLLPLLHYKFGAQLQVLILHRDPWSVALSRANMGNYHPRTWYDDSHEVSPYDEKSIAPEFGNFWKSMNHAEKCLYWWYMVYREVDEFLEREPDVRWSEVSAKSLFSGDGSEKISEFLDINISEVPHAERNPVHRFMLETFPIKDEYKVFANHHQINRYARNRFGYCFDPARIAQRAEKYKLPDRTMPIVRNRVDYWSKRRWLGRRLPGLAMLRRKLLSR